MPTPRPISARRAASRRGSALCWLLLLLCGLVRLGVKPAHAQALHVHHWVAGGAPTLNGGVYASHQDGSAVTEQNPAHRCEIVRVWAYGGSDADACDVPNCPAPWNGTGGEWCDFGDQPAAFGVNIDRWRDTFDDRGEGHFVVKGLDNLWGYFEFKDDADGKSYGRGGRQVFYRVPSTQPDYTSILITPRVDDTGQVAAGMEPVQGGFDDEPSWNGGGVGIPVYGEACDVIQWWVDVPGKCLSCENIAPIASSVVPETGNLSFSVPVTSWSYRGEEIPFSLTYHSFSQTDPTTVAKQPRHPAALSDSSPSGDYNPKWTHTFAQWISLNSAAQAVWHMGDGRTMVFEDGSGGVGTPTWTSHVGDVTLTSQGTATSPPVIHQTEKTPGITVRAASFTLKDQSGTSYRFDQIRWNTLDQPDGARDTYAIPYYLLTSIQDRWGRTLGIGWDDDGVTSVLDGSGRGLTFHYNATSHLIDSISDPYGRTHTLSHGAVGTSLQQRLTAVNVEGPGSPQRVQYHWEFSYGTPTNDLITIKYEPSGKVVHYEYEDPTIPRVTSADYDGVFKRAYWNEETGSGPATREIVRHGSQIVYPGGDGYTWSTINGYANDGSHVASVRHDNTGATTYSAFDGQHNLTATWTNAESQQNPLVTLAYTYTGGNHVAAVSATDLLGHQASASFNPLSLPTEVRALAASGSGHADQVTRFTYDDGVTLTQGNLTEVVAAYGTPSQLTTTLEYGSPFAPDAPTAVTNAVGGRSTATYANRGALLTAASPVNGLVPVGNVDHDPSAVQYAQNAEDLPASVTDAVGHVTTVSYNAESSGSSHLVVTYTNTVDGTTWSVTLDASGNVVRAVDENGVVSTVEYNVHGQPLTARAAAGSAYERVVRYYYGPHQELTAFDPPAGANARITFEYNVYTLGYYFTGPPTLYQPATYCGQVTRVSYPDGTSAYAGYNSVDEPEWRYDAHGLTRLSRDSLHRVYRVEYPTVNGLAGPSVSVQQDEFGRVTQQSDATGTATFAYDDLNRVVTATPAVGRGMTYQYLRDAVNQRWITRETLAGVGTYEYRDDPKGRLNEQYNPLGQWAGFQYAATGHLLKELHGNGTWTDYTYTPRLWPEFIYHYTNGALTDRLYYQYDDGAGSVDRTGRIRRETDLQGRVHGFTYNPLGELTGESHPDFGTLAYTYDAAGNRKSKSNGSVTEYYGRDDQNKLLWANQGANTVPTSGQTAAYRLYTYDGAGFPTLVERGAGGSVANDLLTWDGAGNLRRLQTTGALTADYLAEYDGSGDRVTATINGLQHIYSGDLFDEAGNTLFTPGISENSGGQDGFYQADHLGSTRYLTNGQGVNQSIFRYDAFGSRSAQSGTADTKYGFAGAWGYQGDGPAGLQLLGARYYDPLMGRFISPDPIGFDGGLNLYAYCDDDPVNAVDPSGHGPGSLFFELLKKYGVRFLGAGVGLEIFVPKYSTGEIAGVKRLSKRVQELFQPKLPVEGDSHYWERYGPSRQNAAQREVERRAKKEHWPSGCGEREISGGPLPNIVYRALGANDDPRIGLFPTGPNVDISPISHTSGTKPSPYISTTKSLDFAIEANNRPGTGGYGIVAIDLSKVTSKIIDVSGGYRNGGQFHYWARKQKEILIRGSIPAEAITRIR